MAGDDGDKADGGGVDVGLDALEILDSHVVLIDLNGGVLDLDLRRIGLKTFYSWAPDKPGSFEVDGAVNGVDVAWAGQARPFTDSFSATTTGTISGVTVDRLRRFTGPLGFSRHLGELSCSLDIRVAIGPADGWVVGAKGKIAIEGVELTTDDGLESGVVSLNLDLDTEAAYELESGLTLTGSIGSEVEAFRLADGPNDAIGVSQAAVSLADIAITRVGDFRVVPAPEVSDGQTGRTSLARQMVVWLAALVLEFLDGDLDGKISGVVAANGIEVKTEDLTRSTRIDGRIGAWRTDFESIEANQADDVRTLAGALTTRVANLSADFALSDQMAAISFNELVLSLPRLAGSRGGGAASTNFAGSLKTTGLSTAVKTPGNGTRRELNVGDMLLDVREFSGNRADSKTSGSGQFSVTLGELEGLARTNEGDSRVTGGGVEITMTSLAVDADPDQDVTRGAGELKATELRFQGPGPDQGLTLSVGESRLAFDRTVVVRQDETVSLDGHFDAGVGQLRADIPIASEVTVAEADAIGVAFGPLQLRKSEGRTTLTLSGSARGTTMAARVPALDPVPPLDVRIAELAVALNDMGLEARKDGTPWRLAGNLEAGGLAIDIERESRASVKARKLTAAGVESDQHLAVKVAEISRRPSGSLGYAPIFHRFGVRQRRRREPTGRRAGAKHLRGAP